jgi:hypothetical protein
VLVVVVRAGREILARSSDFICSDETVRKCPVACSWHSRHRRLRASVQRGVGICDIVYPPSLVTWPKFHPPTVSWLNSAQPSRGFHNPNRAAICSREPGILRGTVRFCFPNYPLLSSAGATVLDMNRLVEGTPEESFYHREFHIPTLSASLYLPASRFLSRASHASAQTLYRKRPTVSVIQVTMICETNLQVCLRKDETVILITDFNCQLFDTYNREADCEHCRARHGDCGARERC